MAIGSYEERKLALIEEITAAFDGVSREGGVSLHEAIAMDDCGIGDQEARAAARALDTETRWQDVPDDDIRRGDTVLSFLGPIGFRYYIPAYIVWDLRMWDTEDPGFWSNTFDSIAFELANRASNRAANSDFLFRFRSFSIRQKKAVALYVHFKAEHSALPASELEKLRKRLLSDGVTESKIDEILTTTQKSLSPRDILFNEWQKALDNCWGQFLTAESR